MLISELHVLFEEHLKLAKSKGKSKEAKHVAKDIPGHAEALIKMHFRNSQVTRMKIWFQRPSSILIKVISMHW